LCSAPGSGGLNLLDVAKHGVKTVPGTTSKIQGMIVGYQQNMGIDMEKIMGYDEDKNNSTVGHVPKGCRIPSLCYYQW